MLDCRLDRNSHTILAKHAFAICRVLRLEQFMARHGYHCRADTVGLQGVARRHGDLDFGTRGQQGYLPITLCFTHDISAACTWVVVGVFLTLGRNPLASQRQNGWCARRLQGEGPAFRRFHCVRRPEHIQVRNGAQAGNLFHRLMRRAVFAKPDGIMGHDIDNPLFHRGRQSDRGPTVVSENQERAAIGNQPAMQGDPVHHGRHRVLANTIIDI